MPVMLFDGVCVLCAASVRFVLRHERAHDIRFVAIQSAEGRALALAHGLDADDPASFLFADDTGAFTQSNGVIALARHLRRPASALALLRFVPRPLRDGVYDRIARNRYALFGKREACLLPDAALRARFAVPS